MSENQNCKSCGASLTPEVNKCEYCGADVAHTTTATPHIGTNGPNVTVVKTSSSSSSSKSWSSVTKTTSSSGTTTVNNSPDEAEPDADTDTDEDSGDDLSFDQIISQADRAIADSKRAVAEANKIIQGNKQALENNDQVLRDSDRSLVEAGVKTLFEISGPIDKTMIITFLLTGFTFLAIAISPGSFPFLSHMGSFGGLCFAVFILFAGPFFIYFGITSFIKSLSVRSVVKVLWFGLQVYFFIRFGHYYIH